MPTTCPTPRRRPRCASCGRASRPRRDQSLRERLILHYSPLVKYVAGRVGVGLPPNIEQADLVSYGIFGLIDAIEKFDLERAIKFETYAISRIRGAIIDELRAIDWIPRSVRYKAREVEKAYAALEAQLHRTPTEAEVADRDGHQARGPARDLQPGLVRQRRRARRAAQRRRREGRQAQPRRHPRGHQGRGPGRWRSSPRRRSTCSPRRSTRCPSGRRSSSPSTTTRASRSPRSARCSASPRAASARCTRRPCCSCAASSPSSATDRPRAGHGVGLSGRRAKDQRPGPNHGSRRTGLIAKQPHRVEVGPAAQQPPVQAGPRWAGTRRRLDDADWFADRDPLPDVDAGLDRFVRAAQWSVDDDDDPAPRDSP